MRGRSLVAEGIVFIIRIYQILFSPIWSNCCRFEKSCSNYAIDAIRIYGIFNGLVLASLRIFFCAPWFDNYKSLKFINNYEKKL